VLLAPPAHPSQFTTAVFESFSLSKEVQRRVVARMERTFGERFVDLDGPEAASGLEGSAFIVHDVDDREVPLASGERYAASWPGARILRTRGLGHRRILRDPGVVEQVTLFVAGKPRG
jgi:pimeloyl-ACP methyl ester carboxylesterase